MSDDGIPEIEPLASLIDQVRDLAQDEIPSPRTGRIQLWDDGDYKITFFHSMGTDEEQGVFYDPDTGEVRWRHVVLDPDWEFPDGEDAPPEGEWVEPEYEEFDERTLMTIEPPTEI